MKAIIFTRYGVGAIDSMQLTALEKPSPKVNEVLVRVYATSINSWDWERMQGTPFVNRLMYGLFKPGNTLLGADIAGKVEAVGAKITRFKPGDEVFGDLSRGNWGGFAEYTCAKENALALKPATMSFEQSAAIPQAGLLALQGLRYKGEKRLGQKVLINGASGGMGSFAVQLAKHYGAEVTGVCRSEKTEFVRALGADHVIDYTREDFTAQGVCYDRIIDAQAHHAIADYRRALCPGGVYAMVGGASALVWRLMVLGPWVSWTSDKKMGLLLHKANDGLEEMKTLFEAGNVKPVIDRCYPLHEAAEAMHYYAQGRTKGKIVITVHDA